MRILVCRILTDSQNYIEAYGLSTEDKPMNGIATGSKYTCVDTGEQYLFDELTMQWYLQNK